MSINEADIVWDGPSQKTAPAMNEADIVWDAPSAPQSQEEPNAFLKAVKTVGDYAGKIGDVLANPIDAYTKGLDGIAEDKLKQNALDIIAKADTLDEGSLYSTQIKQLLTMMSENPSVEEINTLKALQEKRNLEYDRLLKENKLGSLGVNDKGEKFLMIGDKNIALDDDIIDELQSGVEANKGVIAGAITGGIKGAKYGSTPQTKALGALVGSAVGSFGGSVADTTLNAFTLDKEINAKLAMQKASEEAIADPILTLLTAGAFKVAGTAIKLPVDVATKVKRYIVDANIDTAKKVIKEQGYSDEMVEGIVENVAKYQHTPQGEKSLDGNLFENVITYTQNKWGKLAKEGTEKEQDAFVDVAMQDATLVGEIEKVLLNSPDLAKPMGNTITNRSATVEKMLEQRSLNPIEIRGKIEAYEKSVKEEYAQTKTLLQEAIPDARFSLKQTNIPESLAEFERAIGDTNIKSDLNALSYRIEQKGDMDIETFIDVREDINRILGKSSVKAYADKEALRSIKQTIDDSLYEAMKSAPIAPEKLNIQFEKSIARYRKMKEIQDTKLYDGIMGEELSDEAISNAVLKGSKTIDGTLDRLLTKLNPNDREAIEHSVVLELYKKNKVRFNDLEATDFVSLGRALDEIKLKNIKSEAVRKTIDDLKQMSRYFKNDPRLLEATKMARDPKLSQGISNNPLVRFHTKVANLVTEFITMYSPLRMGRAPAFRYHLRQSLKKERSTLEFLQEVIKHKEMPPTLLSGLQNALKSYEKELLNEATQPSQKEELKSVQTLIEEMARRVEAQKQPTPKPPKPSSILPERLSLDESERAAQRAYATTKGAQGEAEYLSKLEPNKAYDPYDLGLSPKQEVAAPIPQATKVKDELEFAPRLEESATPAQEPSVQSALMKETPTSKLLVDDADPIADEIEAALKVPTIEVVRWSKKSKKQKEAFEKFASFYKTQSSSQSQTITLSDTEYDALHTTASKLFGTFQGGKQDMAKIAPQIIKQVMPQNAREQITVLKDYFGGGGSWGMFLSKIDLFPNIKQLDIHELSPARAKKIEYIHQHANEVSDFLNSGKMRRKLINVIASELEIGNTGSGTRIAKQLVEDLIKNKSTYSETEQAAMLYLVDYGTASFGKKADAVSVLNHVSSQIRNIGEAMRELKKRGVSINYINADSYALPKEAGSHILAVIDPPYYKTKGYSYFDVDNGEYIEASGKVGRDIYNKTKETIKELTQKQNSIIYTDEAWWTKGGDDGWIEGYQKDALGKNAFHTTLEIIDNADVFMKVPIADRFETLMIKNNTGVQNTPTPKRIDDARANQGSSFERATENSNNDISNRGGGELEPRGSGDNPPSAQRTELAPSPAQETSSLFEPSPKPSLEERVASFIQPTPQEIKAVEALSDLETQKALISIKEGKPTGYAILKYQEAVEKIGKKRFDEEVASLHVSEAALKEKQNTLLAHPRLQELLSMREGVDASQTRYANKQIGKGGLMEDGSFVKDTHTKNPTADFELTKSGVARIQKGGDIPQSILEQLERDLGRMDNDPAYKIIEERNKNIAQWNETSHELTKDAQGNPKIFYHGTAVEFNDFKLSPNSHGADALYFTDIAETADNYSIMSKEMKGAEGNPHVRPVYLKIENPRIADDVTTYEQSVSHIAQAKKEGNDGVIFRNIGDDQGMRYNEDGSTFMLDPVDDFNDRPTNVYVVFSKEQVKSIFEPKDLIFSRGALSVLGISNGITIEEDGSITFDSTDALKGMAIGAGLEIFGSRLLKGGSSTMRRGSIGIRPDETSVKLYAKANEVVSEKMANKMDASALKSMLKNAGVKDEEIAWSGIGELSGVVSKGDVQERLNASVLQLNEIIKTDPTTQKYIAYTEQGGTNYKEYLLTLPQIKPTFKSNHWEENNVVAFMRTKDRNLDGQKSLFVEEIQSDLHQEGRKQGYGTQVPDAPFKTTWHELAFKRIIKEAVENGYESIAWTTAKQQEKRYSLTKSLKELSYKQNSDGTYTLDLSHQNGARDKRAYIAPIDLQDHIGQNLAKRVLEGEGEGTLKQDGLEIGNKGMQLFYDTMMPMSVKKLLKTQPHKVTMDDGQEVWMAKISKERKQTLVKEGIPLYTTIGGTFGIGAGAYGVQQ